MQIQCKLAIFSLSITVCISLCAGHLHKFNKSIYFSSFQLSEYCFAESLPAFLLHQHQCHVVAVNIPLDQLEPAKPGKISDYYPHTQQQIYSVSVILFYIRVQRKTIHFQAVTMIQVQLKCHSQQGPHPPKQIISVRKLPFKCEAQNPIAQLQIHQPHKIFKCKNVQMPNLIL